MYQLYDERRGLLAENDQYQQKNAELQRLACAQRVELDRFTAYIRQDGCGPTASLLGKVEELQDLLIQQRQIADVSKLVEKDAMIRSMNTEIAKKTEQITDLKGRLQQLMAAKGGLQPGQEFGGSNKELVDHLSGLLKAKENDVDHGQR